MLNRSRQCRNEQCKHWSLAGQNPRICFFYKWQHCTCWAEIDKFERKIIVACVFWEKKSAFSFICWNVSFISKFHGSFITLIVFLYFVDTLLDSKFRYLWAELIRLKILRIPPRVELLWWTKYEVSEGQKVYAMPTSTFAFRFVTAN